MGIDATVKIECIKCGDTVGDRIDTIVVIYKGMGIAPYSGIWYHCQ